MRRRLAMAMCVMVAATAHAQPGVEATAPVPAPAPPADGWHPSIYFEPSVLISLGTYSPVEPYLGPYISPNHGASLVRLAVGALLRDRYAGAVPLRVHVGATVAFSGLQSSGSSHGSISAVGVETEIDRPLSRQLRIGARIGIERSERSMNLLALGARVHLRETAWVGVDVFRLTTPHDGSPNCANEMVPGCATSATGVMAGLGLEGKPGAILGAAGVTAAGILVAIAIASFRVPD